MRAINSRQSLEPKDEFNDNDSQKSSTHLTRAQFEITPFKSHRHYLLEASSFAERYNWMSAIQQFINREHLKVISDSIMEGYLLKLNRRSFGGLFIRSSNKSYQWSDRYFVLTKYWLKYYSNSNSLIKTKGQIPLLSDCQVSLESSSTYNNEYVFSITPTQAKGERTYVLQCKSNEIRLKWFEEIKKAIRERQEEITLGTLQTTQ